MYLFAVEAFSAGVAVLGLGALAAGAFWYFAIRPRLADPDALPAAFVPAAHAPQRGGEDDVAAAASPDPAAAEARAAEVNGA
jgi:hypothetical protein